MQAERIQAAYDTEAFRRAGTAIVQTLAEHFQRLGSPPECQSAAGSENGSPKALNWREPMENIADAQACLNRFAEQWQSAEAWTADSIAQRCVALVRESLSRGQNLHHRRYVGHQVPPPAPIAALFDLVGSATNQAMAIYEMGPWSTAVERALIHRLGSLVGFPAGTFGGICTHGGSLANLTALLTARNVALSNVWRDGVPTAAAGKSPVMVVQNDVHYSVTRAAGILGLGTQQLVKVPLDDRRRMDPARLDQILRDLAAAERPVVAVCAAACTTPIGAFDPLREIGAICQRHGVWLHVDAAHGGAALLSARHRGLLDGLELADSLIIDAHKMMFVPALCAFVLYRRKSDRFAAFHQDAPYLFDPAAPGMIEFDNGTQTLECTKRAAAMSLWGLWSVFGPELFGELVDQSFAMAAVWARMLHEAADFQLLYQPQANIVVFRYCPADWSTWSPERLGDMQLRLRQRLVRSGDAYVVPITIDGLGALRTTVINPLTTEADLIDVMAAIRHHGAEVARHESSQ